MLEKLGPYQFESVLGRGGMGTVYRGRHADTGETHAVKVLAPQFTDDEHFRGRFESEIEAMMKLEHPNIVRLVSHGQDSGNLFFAMELVDGKSLYDLQRGGHDFLWPECLSIAVDVCKGLKHAHDRGIIHRDLKPGNLMMTRDGVVKITDFGIAKSYGNSHHTGTNIVGTMDFMSPEQAKGAPVTAKSDIFSLGSVLFTLLVGKPPFSGKSMEESFLNLTRGPVPKIGSRVANVPPEVEELLDKVLEKAPEKRVPTALATLNRILAMQKVLKDESEAQTAHLSFSPPKNAQTVVAQPTERVNELNFDGHDIPNVSVTKVDVSGGKTFADKTAIDVDFQIDSKQEKVKEQAKGTQPKANPTLKPKRARLRKSKGKKSDAIGEDYFTAVTADHRKALQKDGTEEVGSSTGILPLLLMLVATVGIAIGGTWFAMKGPSADALYAEIQNSYQMPENVIAETQEFIERFKNDDRHGEVELLNKVGTSVKAYTSLMKRLRVRARIPGVSRLTEVESQFLKIVDFAETDPKAADAKMVAFVEVHSDRGDLSQRDQDCVDAVDGFRIKLVGAKDRQNKAKVDNINAIFKLAQRESRDQAVIRYQAVIRLYRGENWGKFEGERVRLLRSAAAKIKELLEQPTADDQPEPETDPSTAQ